MLFRPLTQVTQITQCQALRFLLVALLVISPAAASAAGVTGSDSTQPRGAPEDRKNEQGQSLAPVIEGFRSPAYRAAEYEIEYEDWAGSMMANATRDPAFFAALSIANRDFINLVKSFKGDPGDPDSPLSSFLRKIGLEKDISRAEDGSLGPEELLPVAADFCLRCHSPDGWMEAHSEPPTKGSPFLKGQFWGAAFRANPVDASGKPRLVDVSRESETEMDGIDCDFCHRVTDNFKRESRHDKSPMAAGNGGFFVERKSPFCLEHDEKGKCSEESVDPVYDILSEATFCGTCHDVTNPLVPTKTHVAGKIPAMNHPIERTYTEWYWSAYREEEKSCIDCHEPVAFQGAHTWMISPVLPMLWGDFDQVWRGAPYNYEVPDRTAIYKAASRTNREFLRKEAAEFVFVDPPPEAKRGEYLVTRLKVTNKAGHKLPTGFAEGRQMWIHIKAVDESGKMICEDGQMKDGYLVRTKQTKVYEQVALAAGYPFLDENGDGETDEKEMHFHFLLMNYIMKDNRIPPKGFKKAAYNADGAFIIPYDPKDTDYRDGQNWDVTPYRFMIPEWAKGPIRIEAALLYQSFSREYMEFLKEHDTEKTQACGGRARNFPETGPFRASCGSLDTWGAMMYDLWKRADMGPPVELGRATLSVSLDGEPGAPAVPGAGEKAAP